MRSTSWRNFSGHGSTRISADSLLKEALERLARIFRAADAGRGGLALDAHPHGAEGALVGGVLARDALGDGLLALVTRGGIEVRALLAGMQRSAALPAQTRGFVQRLDQRPAQSAAGGGARRRHLDGARLVFGALGHGLKRRIPESYELTVKSCFSGGEGGIRTPDTLTGMPHFECGGINHSPTSPLDSIFSI